MIITSHFLQQYEQFAQQIGEQNNPQVDNLNNQDIEIIPEHPSEEIVLRVEDIPPLDSFYNPKHRAVVRK